MAEESREPRSDEEEDGPATTPFDNPLFLPILLWIFAVWFGYDAFLNSDAHMQEVTTLWFNRIGFPILLLLAIWYTVKGVRERREEAERSAGEGPAPGAE